MKHFINYTITHSPVINFDFIEQAGEIEWEAIHGKIVGGGKRDKSEKSEREIEGKQIWWLSDGQGSIDRWKR